MPPEKSIVLELQRLAVDGQASVTELLRKAKLVATKLKVEDFRNWADLELQGYQKKGDQVPLYRQVVTEIKFRHPNYGYQPVIIQDPEFARSICAALIPNSISELENIVQNDDGPITMEFSPELRNMLMGGMGIFSDTPPTRFIAKNIVVGIVNAIRDIVLTWALKLEAEGIFGEGMSFSEDEKHRAAAPSIHIGNVGSITGNIGGSINAHNVQIGDYGTIHDQLKQLGISQAERNELETLMDAMKVAKPQDKLGLVQRGMDWVGKNAANLGALGAAFRDYFKPQGT